MKLIVFLLLCPIFLFAQKNEIEVAVTARVDTSKEEIKAVYLVFKNYLNSRPDSAYDNPYWNKAEKEKYLPELAPNRAAQWMYYGKNAANTLLVYKPQILSIEPIGEKYLIRTLYYADSLAKEYKIHNPPQITYHVAVKEGGEWKLENYIHEFTKNWKRFSTKYMDYLYSPTLKFDSTEALRSDIFIDSVVTVFDLGPPAKIEYLMAANTDEFMKLYNFDYKLHYWGGNVIDPINQIAVSYGIEFHPHELVHLLFGKSKHLMVSEGITNWLVGPKYSFDFKEQLRIFANEIVDNDTITLTDIIEGHYFHMYDSNPRYITAGLIMQLVYEKGGLEAVKEYYYAEMDNVYEQISKYTGIPEEEIDLQIIEEIKKYAD